MRSLRFFLNTSIYFANISQENPLAQAQNALLVHEQKAAKSVWSIIETAIGVLHRNLYKKAFKKCG